MKARGTLDINEVIDSLMGISHHMGDFTSREDFKKAILKLKEILPAWLGTCILPDGRFLLKMSAKVTKKMSQYEMNQRI